LSVEGIVSSFRRYFEPVFKDGLESVHVEYLIVNDEYFLEGWLTYDGQFDL